MKKGGKKESRDQMRPREIKLDIRNNTGGGN